MWRLRRERRCDVNERDPIMTERSDDELSKLMHDHFAAELDGYVGRAGDRFARSIGPVDAQPGAFGLSRLWWAAPIVAAAAAVAVIVAPAIRTVAPPAKTISDPLVVLPHNNDLDSQISATQAVAFAP